MHALELVDQIVSETFPESFSAMGGVSYVNDASYDSTVYRVVIERLNVGVRVTLDVPSGVVEYNALTHSSIEFGEILDRYRRKIGRGKRGTIILTSASEIVRHTVQGFEVPDPNPYEFGGFGDVVRSEPVYLAQVRGKISTKHDDTVYVDSNFNLHEVGPNELSNKVYLIRKS